MEDEVQEERDLLSTRADMYVKKIESDQFIQAPQQKKCFWDVINIRQKAVSGQKLKVDT